MREPVLCGAEAGLKVKGAAQHQGKFKASQQYTPPMSK
jgi:hypothetical protein